MREVRHQMVEWRRLDVNDAMVWDQYNSAAMATCKYGWFGTARQQNGLIQNYFSATTQNS
jgi:hypothetical protein